MKKIKEQNDRNNFLTNTMPLLASQLTSVRDQALEMFSKMILPNDFHLIKQGEPFKYAYIIVEGECKIVCSDIPSQKSTKLSSDYQAI